MDNQNEQSVPQSPIQPNVTQQVPQPVMSQPLTPPGFVAPHLDAPQTPPALPSSSKKFSLKLGIICLIIFLLLFSSTTVLYAYNIIQFGDKKFQDTVAAFVQGIPFMPKTPRFVMQRSVEVHQEVTRFIIDASIASTSTGLSSMLGTNNFDMQIQGPIDYTDPNNPTVSLHAKITKEFDFDLRSKDYITYVRINKFPTIIALFLTNFGFSADVQQQLLNKWFSFDTRPLDTDARSTLDQTTDNKSVTNKFIESVFETLDDPALREKLVMKSDTLDSKPMYHIHFEPTDEVLDIFWNKYLQAQYPTSQEDLLIENKISDNITKFILDSWVDKKTYYVTKTTVTFIIKAQPASPYDSSLPTAFFPQQTEDIPISFVVNLSDFGKEVPFEKPQNAVPFETFFTTLMASQSGNMYTNAFNGANDTKRQSDVNAILNATNQYMADNKGLIPTEITTLPEVIGTQGANLCSTLVPNYLAAFPVDPSINQGDPVFDCSTFYTTGYQIQRTGDRITVSAPAATAEPISVTR